MCNCSTDNCSGNSRGDSSSSGNSGDNIIPTKSLSSFPSNAARSFVEARDADRLALGAGRKRSRIPEREVKNIAAKDASK